MSRTRNTATGSEPDKDGSIREQGPYVEGKRHGQWVFRSEDGSVWSEGVYVKGRKHGQWVDSFEAVAGGYWDKGSGPYVDDQRHGYWVWRGDDGTSSASGRYVQGKEHGDWVIKDKEGNLKGKGSYVEGKRHGQWVEHEDGGIVAEGPYVEGKRHGEWMIYTEGKKERDSISTLIYENGSVAPVPLKPEMVVIPAGEYRRGCRSDCDYQHWDQAKPVQKVRVESFELSKYEVTFEEYDRFTAATGRDRAGDRGWGRGRRPVIYVSWEDAVAYTKWLSGQTGERYRLPSEAEWEYAARAGVKKKKYSWGNEAGSNRANCDGCGSQWDDEQTAPVGSFGPNGWGLHDLHGNVWEWVQDCWNGSYQGAPTNGSAWESGDCSQRVLRGGSWDPRPQGPCAPRTASGTPPRSGIDIIGFRVARTITP